MTATSDNLIAHYAAVWGRACEWVRWSPGPMIDLAPDFRVVCFDPTESRPLWTYATSGMTTRSTARGIELHIVAPVASDAMVELLTAVAHYHRTGPPLDLYHTVHFGHPWLPGSQCDHGFIALPLLDGPALEICEDPPTHCLWLVPVTTEEVAYKKRHGAEALENALATSAVDLLDPYRRSCV